MVEVEEIRSDKKVNNNSNDNHYSSSGSDGGVIVMMTEQEKPLETYDEMIEEMKQEITTIPERDIGTIEEEEDGLLFRSGSSFQPDGIVIFYPLNS